MAVIDASTIVAAISPDETLADARRLLGDALRSGAVAPSLLLYECGNAFQVKHRRGVIDLAMRDELLDIVANLPVSYEPPDAGIVARRVVPLAARRGLSAYDGSYLELASRTGRPLASFDRRLREAARLEGVALM